MARATAAAVYGRCSMVVRRKSSASPAVSRMASAAVAAASFACQYTSCKAPSACFALPCSWVFTSPVARPNPSSTWPPKFLALPLTRSSFMGVILLQFASSTAGGGVGSPYGCRNGIERFWSWWLRGRALRGASKLAAAVLLLTLDRRSLAPKPFHPDTGSKHADGQQ